MTPSPTPPIPRTTARDKKDGTPTKAKATPDKQPKGKPIDFGKAIGIDKPANVRDKIKKWQADLEGEDSATENKVVTPSDAEIKVEPSPKPRITPKGKPLEEKHTPKLTQTTTKPAEVSPERPKSAKKPAHNKLDDDVRNASAPKKRVVSDSRWLANKTPQKDSTSPRPETNKLPTPTAWVRPRRASRSEIKPVAMVQTGLEPRPMVIFTSPKKTNGEAQKVHAVIPAMIPSVIPVRPKHARPTSSDSLEESKLKRKDGDIGSPTSPTSPPLSGKVEAVRTRRRPRAQTSPRGSLSTEDSIPLVKEPARKSYKYKSKNEDLEVEVIVEDKASRRERTLTDDERPKRRTTHRRERSWASPEDLVGESPFTERRRLQKKSLPEDNEKEARPSPTTAKAETPPRVHGSKVEAWLSVTPDPFLDAEGRRRRRSKESISTTDAPHSNQDKTESKDESVSDRPSSEAKPERESVRRQKSRPRRATIHVDARSVSEVDSAATSTDVVDSIISGKDKGVTPSPTLKRRGARRSQHSPTKERVKSPELEEDAASSAPSSSVDVPVVDMDKKGNKARLENPAMRRLFPSTGKRLSTIASVETFTTDMQDAPPSIATGSETSSHVDPTKPSQEAPLSESGNDTITTLRRRSTRRKLASHADLISVLSMPGAASKSIVSARSIRTNRSRLATATVADILAELASDESKYMRELRTLVDGVIPVLLSCVLSKSDSAVAAGLFSRSASKTDPSSVTKPIIEMGVSLERLKSFHRRIAKDDADSFLTWAQNAQRVYSEYIKSWRLGFQDVVVSLAPADDDPASPTKTVNGPDNTAPWEDGLPQNAEGYVVNGDGERVDVAYMLKRPLVRLKYLSKTIKGLHHLKPSALTEKVSNEYQRLVDEARRRSNEERARLEDEAAAAIDPTRARDPRSLAPLKGVRIDPTRCVRARDYFDMHLIHSSGQEVVCRVELLLRDDAPGNASDGDVLICEVDSTDRWLFFPPIKAGRISARNGDSKGELVVLIRGYYSNGTEWSEALSLKSEDEQAGLEWVQMLGTTPVPPPLGELKRKTSLNKTPRPTSSDASSSFVSAATESTTPRKSRTPSPNEIDIPIGEQAKATSKKWGYETPDRNNKSPDTSPITPPSSDNLGRSIKPADSLVSFPSSVNADVPAEDELNDRDGRDDDSAIDRTPRNLNEAMAMAGSGSPVGLRRTRAKRVSRHSPQPSSQSRPSRQIVLDDPLPEEPEQPRRVSRRHRGPAPSETSSLSQPSKGFSVWIPSSDVGSSDSSDESDEDQKTDYQPPKRPQMHRRTSPVPSMVLPSIPKLRKASRPSTPVHEPSRDEDLEVKEPPRSAPGKLERKGSAPVEEQDTEDKPPPVPPHRSPSPASPVSLKSSSTPVFTPKLPGHKVRRRSSSPLKHEYEPSTATESSSESESDVVDDDYSSSESSGDELEDDVPTPLMPIGQASKRKVSPTSSIYNLPNGTITPSQSASNTPYRAVPKGTGQASKSVASIFCWSDAGKWELLHPDECSIVVCPGKVEVYEITAEHSKPLMADGDEIMQTDGRAPLIALELTPLVLLRKGTAIDISIRSRPTPESRIHKGSNFMLRSRNPTECTDLYAMIHHSRMNNPTYIALQNARGVSYGQTNWSQAMDAKNAARSNAGSSTSWWNLGGTLGRRSSYRASSTRAASISAATESSVGTMNTAFRSALNRFTFRNGKFNIRGSTLGSRSTRSFDSGSGSNGSGSGTNTPTFSPQGTASGSPAGITNTKIRLYERETASKWRELGSGRLSIMLPDPNAASTTRQGQGSPGVRDLSQEKRILITNKKGGTLLDVTLDESCFERIARTGIAVSVWEDVVGTDGEVGVGAVGGVSGARARIFMVQMKSERECAYSFSLLGKQRY